MGSIAIEIGIQSPCVKLCDIDRDTGLCGACGRSLAEIASWSAMSTLERRSIMAELPARKAELLEGDPR
ncbi:MAG: DUF1289 domain-containing protein [Hyphomicrobium sp.]